MASSRTEMTVQSIDGLYVTGHELRVTHSHHASSEEGVYEGVYDEMEVSLGSTTSKVAVGKGVGLTGGLLMTITNQFEIDLPVVSENTRVIVALQGSLADEGLESDVVIVTGTTTAYPELTKNNLINNESGIYQTELARGIVTSGTILSFDDSHKTIITKNSGEKIDGKLSIVDPEEVQGTLAIVGDTSTALTLQGTSTSSRIKFKNGEGEYFSEFVTYDNDSGSIGLYVYPAGGGISTAKSQFEVSTNGAYVNDSRLLTEDEAFTQSTADGRYLKLTGGTLSGNLYFTGRDNPIQATGNDSGDLTLIKGKWQNENTRFNLQHSVTEDDLVRVVAYDINGDAINGLRIQSGDVYHYGTEKYLAYKADVMANSGDKNITGTINFTNTSVPISIENVTDTTLTSIGRVVNKSGDVVYGNLFRGENNNMTIYNVGYNTSGSIIAGLRCTTDGVYDYGSGGTLTLSTNLLQSEIESLEMQISMQEQIENQANQIELMQLQIQALANGETVPTELKTAKVESDESIELKSKLALKKDELNVQQEQDKAVSDNSPNATELEV